MAKEIPLTRGLVAIVDDEDFEWLNQWKWHAKLCARSKVNAYAQTSIRKSDGRRSNLLMHRLITKADNNLIIVDHIDHNGLNNQRSNLRLCSQSENSQNSRIRRLGKSSRFKGVSLHKQTSKWCARLAYSGRRINMGLFESEEDAARHYNAAALKYHGDFACLNDVLPLLPSGPVPKKIPKPAPTLKSISSANKSGYRGVVRSMSKNKWISQISIRGTTKRIGTFHTPEDAARAYDAKARELRGNRARLNFPDNPETGCQ